MFGRRLIDLLMAAVALGVALTVIVSHPIAGLCLVQYVLLTLLEYESETFREYMSEH